MIKQTIAPKSTPSMMKKIMNTKTPLQEQARFKQPTPVPPTAPKSQSPFALNSSASPGAFAAERKDKKGLVECQINETLQDCPASILSRPRVEVSIFPGNVQNDIKYMYDKISERSNAADGRIMELRDVIAEHYGFSGDIAHAGHISPAEVRTVGKIMADTDGKLNVDNALIEMPRVQGGSKVTLKLNKVDSYSLFPGLVVGLEGVNNVGADLFTVKKVLEPPLPDRAYSTVSEVNNYNHGASSLAGASMNVVFSAGPYTTENSLAFEPFMNFMDQVEQQRPDVLILAGPFIEDSNTALATLDADADEILSHVFASRILGLLKENSHTQVVLIPSCDDFTNGYMAFPQPAMTKDMFEPLISQTSKQHTKETRKLLERVHCLPNPCVFSLNEIVFAVSSKDILFDLATEEIAMAPSCQDRIARMAQHLMQQRSFYPLIPSSDNTGGLVDFSHAQYAKLAIVPDVLIVPSKIVNTIKTVDSCLVVNPGALCKRKATGTFAKLRFMPLAKIEEDPEATTYHNVPQRCHAQVVHL